MMWDTERVAYVWVLEILFLLKYVTVVQCLDEL
jgi:hypothetical protein